MRTFPAPLYPYTRAWIIFLHIGEKISGDLILKIVSSSFNYLALRLHPVFSSS